MQSIFRAVGEIIPFVSTHDWAYTELAWHAAGEHVACRSGVEHGRLLFGLALGSSNRSTPKLSSHVGSFFPNLKAG